MKNKDFENEYIYNIEIGSKNDLINTSATKEKYRNITLPNDYSGIEKRLISIIQEIYPQYDWLNTIPFRRDCSDQELNLIEQGLRSANFERRYNALLNFVDLVLLAQDDMATIEEQMKKRFKMYFEMPFPEEFKTKFAEMIHREVVQGYKEQIMLSIAGIEDEKKIQERCELIDLPMRLTRESKNNKND